MQIYLDLDGVLADFDKSALVLFGMPPREYEELHGKKKFWKMIAKEENFFGDLELMPDAMKLWNEVYKIHEPIILTSCPWGNWAPYQKLLWKNKHFGETIKMICTEGAKTKKHYCKVGDILIDDYYKYKHLWEEAGGIFIHHLNIDNTLSELYKVLNL